MLNKYLHKTLIKKYKRKYSDFKSFKKVIPLPLFKQYYIKDFYNDRELEILRKFLNIGQELLHIFLIKRHLLNRVVEKKYYFMISPSKMLPNRFLSFKRRYFKRKKRKKNLKLRFKFFFRSNYDNFLFYLTIFNKQVIIKPFNFLHALFYYKKRIFKKIYIIRKRRRIRFRRFYYKYLRRRRRRLVRRRIKYLKYRLKKKFVMKRFHAMKIKRFKNFFKVIAFFHLCKQKKKKIDDNFKIKSIFSLPYKLLKFNFNKIHNSYNFFINFKQRKKKIKILNTNNNNNKNIFNSEKIPVYDNIKIILKNRLINNKIVKKKKQKKQQLKELIFFNKKKNNTKKKKDLIFSNKKKLKKKNKVLNSNMLNLSDTSLYNNNFLIDFLKNENIIYKKFFSKKKHFPDYLIVTSSIKNNINSIKFFKKKKVYKLYKLIVLMKLIDKLSKKILFFKKKLNNFFLKQKRKLSRFFLRLLKINKKLLKKFNKYKKIIYNFIYIIKQLKNKLEEFILNFYIIYNTINKMDINNMTFLKKVYYCLKKRKFKSKFKNNRKLVFSFLFLKRRFVFSKNKRFIFSYTNKINNRLLKRWRRKFFFRKKYRKQKKGFFRRVKKTFNVSSFYLYKNYFNKKKILKNNFFSHFCNKKFKYLYFCFFKKANINYSKNIQINKNVDFLQKKII